MALAFPNRKTFLKTGAETLRFFGVDGMRPVRFSITREALEALAGDRLQSHQALKAAFDRHSRTVYALAAQTYLAKPRGDGVVHQIHAQVAVQYQGQRVVMCGLS